MKKRAMGSHHSARMGKDEWLTPPEIIKSLGEFDLDPCSPINRPWDTAKQHFTVEDNGLLLPWNGRVWLNPPYGKEAVHWLRRLAEHKCGTALIFARTETAMFFETVWSKAESVLFLKGRLHFHHVDGTRAKANGGAPSVLIAYDEMNAEKLEESGLEGKHLYLKGNVFVVGLSRDNKTWRVVVGEAVEELGGKATVNDIYEKVVDMAPAKVRKNKNYKAKVRQMLQFHHKQITRGTYAA
jgi:hypothetical protein